MNRITRSLIFRILLLLCPAVFAAPDYQLQTLADAHTLFKSASNTTEYAAAAKQFEYLVDEEQIQNGHLFYTLGNAYFLSGDLGHAILNYRRAERFLPGDSDLQHNLKTALAKQTDFIEAKEQNPLVAKLFGWHLNSSPRVRWWLFAAGYLILWGAWNWHRRRPRNESRITLISTGVFVIILASSLITEVVQSTQSDPGVILASEVLARKGDGELYEPAFLDPLHAGTEFQRIENRGDWWQIRLADGQTCWIPAIAADTI